VAIPIERSPPPPAKERGGLGQRVPEPTVLAVANAKGNREKDPFRLLDFVASFFFRRKPEQNRAAREGASIIKSRVMMTPTLRRQRTGPPSSSLSP